VNTITETIGCKIAELESQKKHLDAQTEVLREILEKVGIDEMKPVEETPRGKNRKKTKEKKTRTTSRGGAFKEAEPKKRRGRPPKVKAQEFDPSDPPRSSCHGARLVTSQGDEGTSCYVCLTCGEPCDVDGTNGEANTRKANRPKERKKREPCSKCGSKISRHKPGCDGNLPPEE
jgi:DNA-directed RNA polymerase subunit RPC12/RpoP